MSVNQHTGAGKELDRSEIEIGLLQMQILWFLKKRKMHGYELMKKLNTIKNTKITQGTLYPSMQRLVELRLVDYEEKDRRKIYRITKKGSRIMERTCADFVATFGGIFEDFVCMRCDGVNTVSIGKGTK